jgi:IS5 family transposase
MGTFTLFIIRPMVGAFKRMKRLIADRAYDSDPLRKRLKAKKLT